MPNIIEQATRASLGLSTSAPSTVTSYVHTIGVGGFGAPTNVIDGTGAADSIFANTTTNYIFGFGGNDTLSAVTASGGLSPAILSGGNGADTFVFDSSTGTALTGALSGSVLDFSASDGDKLDLSGTDLSFSQLTITVNGNGTSASVQGTGINLVLSGTPGDVVLNSSNVITSGTGTGSGATTGNDLYNGQDGVDVYSGLEGNDTINGLSGNDDLNGNLGNDIVSGGNDNDTVQGGQGNDYVNGNLGNDNVNGNLGDDTVEGGRDADTVRGGQGNDLVNGNIGNDVVYGDKGDDTVRGGADNDTILAGEGNDHIYGDRGNDNLTGNSGNDIFFFAADHGSDVVTDFVSGQDKLAFSSAVFASKAAAVAAFSGGVITNSFGTITLSGIASITESDIDLF